MDPKLAAQAVNSDVKEILNQKRLLIPILHPDGLGTLVDAYEFDIVPQSGIVDP